VNIMTIQDTRLAISTNRATATRVRALEDEGGGRLPPVTSNAGYRERSLALAWLAANKISAEPRSCFHFRYGAALLLKAKRSFRWPGCLLRSQQQLPAVGDFSLTDALGTCAC
jgi:hypothetical protein